MHGSNANWQTWRTGHAVIIKIRCIAETVQSLKLAGYAKGLIKALLPDLKNIKLVIDRIYRLPIPWGIIPEVTNPLKFADIQSLLLTTSSMP